MSQQYLALKQTLATAALDTLDYEVLDHAILQCRQSARQFLTQAVNTSLQKDTPHHPELPALNLGLAALPHFESYKVAPLFTSWFSHKVTITPDFDIKTDPYLPVELSHSSFLNRVYNKAVRDVLDKTDCDNADSLPKLVEVLASYNRSRNDAYVLVTEPALAEGMDDPHFQHLVHSTHNDHIVIAGSDKLVALAIYPRMLRSRNAPVVTVETTMRAFSETPGQLEILASTSTSLAVTFEATALSVRRLP